MCKIEYGHGNEREELHHQWCTKVDELQSIDGLLQTLREEIQQIERRRTSVANAEASLRQQLECGASASGPSQVAHDEAVRLNSSAPEGDDLMQLCMSVSAACKGVSSAASVTKRHSHEEPVMFSMDDDEENETRKEPSPVHDWEMGLDHLNRKPSAQDRGTHMRHRMALASLKQAGSAGTSGTSSTKKTSMKGVEDESVWHRIGRTVSMF